MILSEGKIQIYRVLFSKKRSLTVPFWEQLYMYPFSLYLYTDAEIIYIIILLIYYDIYSYYNILQYILIIVHVIFTEIQFYSAY